MDRRSEDERGPWMLCYGYVVPTSSTLSGESRSVFIIYECLHANQLFWGDSRD